MKVNTASGDVRFEHVGGDAQVNSASGDVNLDRVDGALTVNTASGDVEIRRVHGGRERFAPPLATSRSMRPTLR